MFILGSGLAGLLAGNLFRRYNPLILEKQESLPNNHNAVLRHRDAAISHSTLIPFKQVKVHKAVNYKGDIYNYITPRMANEYSLKVTGKVLSRSIINLSPATRYIAPPDFVRQLSKQCEIAFNTTICREWVEENASMPIISTIPLPVMYGMMFPDDPDMELSYQSISTAYCYIESPDVDVYQTIYYPNPDLGMYRMSITGNKVMAEFIFDDYTYPDTRHGIGNLEEYVLHFLERDFGINPKEYTPVKLQTSKYGKISPMDENKRKAAIYKLTSQYNIFSLGRFATWRNLLLDDVYDDVGKIERMISQMAITPQINWR